MRRNYPSENLNTTLGDLIEAVSEVAFEYSDNPREAYTLARIALVEILRTASFPSDSDNTAVDRISKKHYLH